MALSKGTTTGTPRIFVSLIQWARAVGLPIVYNSQGLTFATDTPNLSYLFDMNPIRTSSFVTTNTSSMDIAINNRGYGGDGDSVIQRL